MEERFWHRFYPEKVRWSLDYPNVPLPRLVEDAARDDGTTTALVFFNRRFSCSWLGEQVDRLAAALSAMGADYMPFPLSVLYPMKAKKEGHFRAMLTHRNLLANALQCREWNAEARPGDEGILAALPLFHSYGMTTCMNFGILMHSPIVLMPRFNAMDAMKAIQKHIWGQNKIGTIGLKP